MQTAFILVETQVGKGSAVARRVPRSSGVASVEAVTGPYDVVLRVEASSLTEIHSAMVAPLRADAAVTRALLCPVVDREVGPSTRFEPEPFTIAKPEPALAGVGAWAS